MNKATVTISLEEYERIQAELETLQTAVKDMGVALAADSTDYITLEQKYVDDKVYYVAADRDEVLKYALDIISNCKDRFTAANDLIEDLQEYCRKLKDECDMLKRENDVLARQIKDLTSSRGFAFWK